MTANRRRGEIEAELDGKPYRLCLTLGALAELEAAYAADDLGALVERFSRGRLSALDMIRIIGAGLRGAGNDIADDGVRAMRSDRRRGGFRDHRHRSSDHDVRHGATGRAAAKPLNAAAGKANEFPWDSVMAAAFGLLRLSPKNLLVDDAARDWSGQ